MESSLAAVPKIIKPNSEFFMKLHALVSWSKKQEEKLLLLVKAHFLTTKLKHMTTDCHSESEVHNKLKEWCIFSDFIEFLFYYWVLEIIKRKINVCMNKSLNFVIVEMSKAKHREQKWELRNKVNKIVQKSPKHMQNRQWYTILFKSINAIHF